MQLHDLKPDNKSKKAKRIGRGGKRGTYSGKGQKGQKSRAGAKIRPGFRGGDNPIWKLFPKQRGASKKVAIKKRTFKIVGVKPAIVNLKTLNGYFQDGEVVSKKSLVKRGIIKTGKKGVKILSGGELKKKLTLNGLEFSESAKEKIIKSGSTIK